MAINVFLYVLAILKRIQNRNIADYVNNNEFIVFQSTALALIEPPWLHALCQLPKMYVTKILKVFVSVTMSNYVLWVTISNYEF